MRRLPLLLSIALFAVAFAAPAPAQAAKLGAATKLVNQSLKRVVQAEGGPPGAIALIERRGERRRTIKAGYGNLTPQERPKPGDHMRIASVAKAFSGAVALSLVEEGRITLDTTIGQRLPDLPAAWHGVTLRQLLHHTSGVPDYTQDPDFQATVGADPQAYIAPRQLLEFVADQPLGFVPDSTYRYSNSENIIVGLMAEAATNTPYETLLATHVYAPLGLRNTSLPNTPAIPEPFIHGFEITFGEPPEDISTAINPAGAWASGGIVSTPADLNRFVRGYVGGQLFGREIKTQQFQFIRGNSDPPGPGSNFAGLAVFKYNTNCGTVFGHTGSFPGYTQFIAAKRNGQASVVVSVNAQVGPGEPAVYGELVKAQRHAVCAALTRGK
jgi:D-alanyl-D-alanine carboxypeptidase